MKKKQIEVDCYEVRENYEAHIFEPKHVPSTKLLGRSWSG